MNLTITSPARTPFRAPLKITVSQAARIMGKSDLFVRIGMQRGLLPIGEAYQMPDSTRWTYYISPAQLAEYIGVTMEELRSWL